MMSWWGMGSSGGRRRGRVGRFTARVDGLEPRRLLTSGDGLPVIDFLIDNNWGSGFQGRVLITNDENREFVDWSLAFDLPHTITNIWNAQITEHAGNHYEVTHAGWNEAIAPGATVSFGFVATTVGVPSGPTNYEFSDTVDDPAPPSTGRVTASFRVVSDWGSGFTGEIVLNNPGPEPVRGWVLEFDFPRSLNNIWNASVMARQGSRYTITAASWNKTIPAGGSVSFGFNATPGNLGTITPRNYVLNGIPLGGTEVPPTISVEDVVVTEPDIGMTTARLTVQLSRPALEAISVQYTTRDGSATAGSDYVATTGTITFAAGESSRNVDVSIQGDRADEPDETFALVLSNPIGATLARAEATVTIVDNDPTPVVTPEVSINDALVEVTDAPGVAPGFFRTNGNQIVDSAGNPVKIAGVNWFGFESNTFAPHGLWARNYRDMMDQMKAEGFNTIRLPYSNQLFDAGSLPNGISFFHNPDLQGLSGLQILDRIVDYAGQLGLRIFLDHHRSSAGAGAEGSGLWYTEAYPESRWISDWVLLAQRYAGNPTVLGGDLHNEPHGPARWGTGDQATDWRLAAERAGNAILAANPAWLIIVEGVQQDAQGRSTWWGGNLADAGQFPVRLNVPNRLVYSPHDYPASVYPQSWFSDPNYPNNLPEVWDRNWGYLFQQDIAPVLLGEFGSKFETESDRIWAQALVRYLGGDFDLNGSNDLDTGDLGLSWTYWSWNPNSGDTGGILKDDWSTVHRNKLDVIAPIQYPFDTAPAPAATFTVTLSEPSQQAVSVDFHTVDGTAVAGMDYTAVSGTITFAPGETTQTIAVPILGGPADMPDQQFTILLGNPNGVNLLDGEGVAIIRRRRS